MKYSKLAKVIVWILVVSCTVYSVQYLISFAIVNSKPSAPSINAPALLEWDKVEVFGAVKKEIVIKNQGGAELQIRHIQSTCGCLGLEKMENGQLTAIKELNLKPGESFISTIRMEARGNAGSKIRQRISFSTNDPLHPTFHIDGVIHQITGGVTGIPSSIYAGTLLPGDLVENSFEVIDGAELPRHLEKLTTSDSAHEVTLISTERKELMVEGKRMGTLIAKGKVKTVAPKQTGAFNYTVRIYLANSGRPPDEIVVSGIVQQPVSFQPTVIMLPKANASGYSYEQSILVTNSTEHLCQLQLVENQLGVECVVPASLLAGESAVIRVFSNPAEIMKTITGSININVKWSKGSYQQTLPYRISKP